MRKVKFGIIGTGGIACYPGLPRRVELSGTQGSVLLEDDRILRWSFADAQPEDAEIRRLGAEGEGQMGGASQPLAISPDGHRRQIEELASAILNGKGLTTPGSEGERAIELICAVYESARTGETVRFL
jgi:predicted dehydrogenase